MKGFYERFSEYLKENNITLGLPKREDTSQFLNSRPEELPIIGIIPMTGEGIDSDIDDLAFYNHNKIVNSHSIKEESYNLELKRKREKFPY